MILHHDNHMRCELIGSTLASYCLGSKFVLRRNWLLTISGGQQYNSTRSHPQQSAKAETPFHVFSFGIGALLAQSFLLLVLKKIFLLAIRKNNIWFKFQHQNISFSQILLDKWAFFCFSNYFDFLQLDHVVGKVFLMHIIDRIRLVSYYLRIRLRIKPFLSSLINLTSTSASYRFVHSIPSK